mmetsp:Transcript_20271/g.20030  ORF Transcript_20271/g.20030 Transcript_20271/m.20030 type:complete len:88 (+) Transcript_20271:471-734(+)
MYKQKIRSLAVKGNILNASALLCDDGNSTMRHNKKRRKVIITIINDNNYAHVFYSTIVYGFTVLSLPSSLFFAVTASSSSPTTAVFG